jgi:hypothetical protein
MFISAITIENFKSIKEPVRIELKPITLLYGANSVGKSTVIQALNYAREIMEKSSVDVYQTESGGDTISLGGFLNTVHNHDISNSIRLKYEIDFPEFIHKSSLNNEIEERLKEIFDEILPRYPDDVKLFTRFYSEQFKKRSSVWFELVIRQDSREEYPYISIATAGVGDDPLIILGYNSCNDHSPTVKFIDIEHPLFPIINGNTLASYFISNSYLDNTIDEDQNIITCNWFSRLPDCDFYLHLGGNPYFDQINDDFKDDYSRFEEILKAIWKMHFGKVKANLSDFLYLGPLREIPDNTFDPHDPKNHCWDKGLAAWAEISLGSNLFLDHINSAFEEDLKTQYTIVLKEFKELDLDSSLYHQLSDKEYVNIGDDIREMLINLPVKRRILIREKSRDIELMPKDIGVGISQVLPIIPLVIGTSLDKDGIIAIEQPELHIHPAMQVGLADVFIEAIRYEWNILARKRLVLETHSEHILLRLLRRLRDPEEDQDELTADDLGIYFFENSDNGMIATRIRVNEEGEFKDPWPRGFFNERAEELF